MIDKTFFLIASIKTAGFVSGGALLLFVFLITFNAVKLSVLLSKNEIAAMRLVGASNWFIKGPFLVQGIFYALISVLLVNFIFLVGLLFFNPQITNWLGVDFFAYFQQNILLIGAVQIIGAVFISLFSTSFALRKYLKV